MLLKEPEKWVPICRECLMKVKRIDYTWSGITGIPNTRGRELAQRLDKALREAGIF